MSLGLVSRTSCGWRRVIAIADQGLVALLVRVAASVLASQNGSFLEAALVQNRHFWRLVRVRALADQKGSFLKAGLVQNRQFWTLVRVRALADQNGTFLKAGLVQNRHFCALVLVPACQVMSRHVASRHVAS